MNRARFERILATQSCTRREARMHALILAELDAMSSSIVAQEIDGIIYASKGAGPAPAFVAHTDTVHAIIPNDEYRVYEEAGAYYGVNKRTGAYTGVGGDDKCGIAIALDCFEQLPAARAVFVPEEESGCRGSARADLAFFADATFVLQADRKGNAEFVDDAAGEELHGPDFAAAVAPILSARGYRSVFGGLTDVTELKQRGLQVAAANCSAGYYNPHRADEVIHYPDVERTQELFTAIAQELGRQTWTHAPIRPTYSYRELMDDYRAARVAALTATYTHSQPSRAARRQHGPQKAASQWQRRARSEPVKPCPPETCPKCGLDRIMEYDPYEDAFYCWVCGDYTSAPERQPEPLTTPYHLPD